MFSATGGPARPRGDAGAGTGGSERPSRVRTRRDLRTVARFRACLLARRRYRLLHARRRDRRLAPARRYVVGARGRAVLRPVGRLGAGDGTRWLVPDLRIEPPGARTGRGARRRVGLSEARDIPRARREPVARRASRRWLGAAG